MGSTRPPAAESRPTWMISAFHFGGNERRLFGIYACSSAMRTRGLHGVLFCNPFGQEAIRLHRLLKVVAERLARDGAATLRFDYFGTGDSAGEDAECDLEGWQEDVRTAHQELVSRSGAERVTWFGAGLGGTVVMLASQGAVRPQRAVLWNPVVDGPAYLEQLRLKHVQALEASYTFPDPSWREALRDPAAFRHEASGFEISARFRAQIAALARVTAPPATVDTHVIADPADVALRRWLETEYRAHQEGTAVTQLADPFEWSAEELEGTALVPRVAVECLLRALT
jgi:alpha/beta superfamily hydrolase